MDLKGRQTEFITVRLGKRERERERERNEVGLSKFIKIENN